jgi:hypothetical protein
MDGNRVFRRHAQKHAPKPIVRERSQEVGCNGKLRTTEGRRDGVASERNLIVRRNVLLVPGWQAVGQKRDINGLADEESLHGRAC